MDGSGAAPSRPVSDGASSNTATNRVLSPSTNDTQREILGTAEVRSLSPSKVSNVLVIGAGMVSGACVRHLLTRPNTKVLLVDANSDAIANTTAAAGANTDRIVAKVEDLTTISPTMQRLIRDSDVVISLLPASMHPRIARVAVQRRVPFITTSYVSEEMEKLRASVGDSVVINEMGLDPGIDILTSAKLLDTIRAEGGVIDSYLSLCGALPEPRLRHCPMSYKFSWSPRGVLTAATRPSQFRINGEMHNIQGPDLYQHVHRLPTFEGMVWVPNGDVTPYIERYKLQGVPTVVRGTIRFDKFAPVVNAFVELGWLNSDVTIRSICDDERPTWSALLRETLRSKRSSTLSTFLQNCVAIWQQDMKNSPTYEALGDVWPDTSRKAERPPQVLIEKTFSELGLSSSALVPQVSSGLVIDALCEQLKRHLMYEPSERDYILMVHRVIADFPRENVRRVYQCVLSLTGSSNVDTATARTVGIPAAVAAHLILDKKLSVTGMVSPTWPEIYSHVLPELQKEGITMKEKITTQSYPLSNY